MGTSGAQESITITADKGRPSQEEIDEMLRAAGEFAEEDARMAETVQAKNQLESAAYNLKNQLEDEEKLGGRLSDEDKETLFEAANDVIDWMTIQMPTGMIIRRNSKSLTTLHSPF